MVCLINVLSNLWQFKLICLLMIFIVILRIWVHVKNPAKIILPLTR